MFWGKKKNNTPPEIEVKVHTIPPDFYAGQNPVVKFKKVTEEVRTKRAGALTSAEKEMFNKTTVVGGDKKWHPANLLTNRRFLLFVGLALFAAFVAVSGVYYWYAINKEKKSAVVPAPVALTEIPVESPPAEIVVETTPLPEENAAPEEEPSEPKEILPVYPSRLLANGPDMDQDDVGDMAEETFQTDAGAPDTDLDKHADGHEIFHLYNPTGKEPQKLIDSGLIKEYVNPVFKYSTYHPATWAVGNTDQSFKDVLFSTLTGEYVEVRVIEKESNQTFVDWFAVWAPGEQFEALQPFQSKFKEDGWTRDDNLAYYFPRADRVYLLIYHTTDSGTINFKIVAKMMARSFRLLETEVVIPPQITEETPVILETSTLFATTSSEASASTSGGVSSF